MLFQLTDENAAKTIASGKPLVVDCWASWCHSCTLQMPEIEELAKEFGRKAVFAAYTLDDWCDFASERRIQSLPTVLFFKDGKEIPALRCAGCLPKAAFRERVLELLRWPERNAPETFSDENP